MNTLGFRSRPFWLLVLLGITFGQVALALHAWPGASPLLTLQNDEPVLNGRHPLHFYHASLGAKTFQTDQATTCYDPAFQAGYPKTPIFDAGSRPAELIFTIFGQGVGTAALYKQMLFGLGLLVPWIFAIAGRGFQLPASAACLAAATGSFLWWTAPVQQLLRDGQIELLTVGLCILMFLGNLVRYGTQPSVFAWVLMAAASIFGWYFHPPMWVGTLPIVLLYYLMQAPRWGVAWHLGFIGVLVVGIAPNLWWLADWSRFWWLRQPIVTPYGWPNLDTIFQQFGNYTVCNTESVFEKAILVLAGVGILGLLRAKCHCSAAVLSLFALSAIIVRRFGDTWQPAEQFHAKDALLLLLASAVFPAAWLIERLLQSAKIGMAILVVIALTPCVVGVAGWWKAPNVVYGHPNIPTWSLGLSSNQQAIVAGLTKHTTREARILWEVQTTTTHPTWNWTALLPDLTQRAFIGGLESDLVIEHFTCGLQDGILNGRALADWTAEERSEYIVQYNIGWIVCRSAEALAFWLAEPNVREVGRYQDFGEVVLLEIQRQHSYFLSGSGRIERADSGKIVLLDLQPNAQGEVLLSFHYQPDLRVGLPTVWPVRCPDLHDPIPFLKLKMQAPVSRVTLTWEHP